MYGGRRSGWLTVAAGATTTVLDLEEPRNTVAPVITGTTKVGDVLTATDGTYTGSPVLTFTSRQWQRRAGAVGITPAGPWTAIVRPVPDPTPNAYTLTAADVGQELRFVTTVSNPIATWGMGLSAPLLIPSAAVNDTATVLEDAAATPIPVLTNDTHPVGGVIRLTVTQPAHGTAAVIPGSTGTPATNDGVSYKPNANYCNAPGAAATDNFAYTVNGGATATVAMTVTCVDDSPVAVDDAATVGRDSGATSIGVLANDTDVDGGTLQVASATQAPHGTVAITGGGSGLSYAPSAGYCGAVDTFTYKVNGGSQATVSVTVTCPETARVDAPATLTEATSPPAATSAPAATAKPSSIVPFTCRIARGKMVTLSCKVTDKSGKLKTATIRATRGTRTVGRASGKVKLGNTVPTLRIKRGVRQVNTKITITVKLANGKFRVLTRTLKV
jgi:hypothetical protein